MLAGVVAGMVWPVPETAHLDRQPAIYWAEARLAFHPEPETGPVVVQVEYTVAPEREAAFLEAMDQLRRSRLQTGATRWELYRDGQRPNRFLEIFSVPSWEEHLRRHHGAGAGGGTTVDDDVRTVQAPLGPGPRLTPG